MENAHLRMGLLEFERYTEKIATRIRVRVGHYIGDGDEVHLLSVLGATEPLGRHCGQILDRYRGKSNWGSDVSGVDARVGAVSRRRKQLWNNRLITLLTEPLSDRPPWRVWRVYKPQSKRQRAVSRQSMRA